MEEGAETGQWDPVRKGQRGAAKGWLCDLLTLTESQGCWEESKLSTPANPTDNCDAGRGQWCPPPGSHCFPVSPWLSAAAQFSGAGLPCHVANAVMSSGTPCLQDSQLSPEERIQGCQEPCVTHVTSQAQCPTYKMGQATCSLRALGASHAGAPILDSKWGGLVSTERERPCWPRIWQQS